MNHYYVGWFTIRSGLMYRMPHISYSWSPPSKAALLAAVQVMTSCSGNLLAQYNQNFFLSIFMVSLSYQRRHYKFTLLQIKFLCMRKRR